MSPKSNNLSNSPSHPNGRPPGSNNTTINVHTNGCGIKRSHTDVEEEIENPGPVAGQNAHIKRCSN